MTDNSASAAVQLSPEIEVKLHAYFAAFLGPAATEDAVREVRDDVAFWGDHGVVEVFQAAHVVLDARARVTTEVEALVLVEDAGLSVRDAAGVLQTDETRLRSVLAEAFALADEVETEAAAPVSEREVPAPITNPLDGVWDDEDADAVLVDAPMSPVEATPASAPAATLPAATLPAQTVLPDGAAAGVATGPGTRSPQALRVAVAVLFLAVALLTLLLLLKTTDPGGIVAAPDASIVITDARLSDVIDRTGNPGPERTTFTTDETVRLWFTYEKKTGDQIEMSAVWFREGEDDALYRSQFILPDDRTILTMSRLFMQEAGAYRVEIREGDTTLLRRPFQVRAVN